MIDVRTHRRRNDLRAVVRAGGIAVRWDLQTCDNIGYMAAKGGAPSGHQRYTHCQRILSRSGGSAGEAHVRVVRGRERVRARQSSLPRSCEAGKGPRWACVSEHVRQVESACRESRLVMVRAWVCGQRSWTLCALWTRPVRDVRRLPYDRRG